MVECSSEDEAAGSVEDREGRGAGGKGRGCGPAEDCGTAARVPLNLQSALCILTSAFALHSVSLLPRAVSREL